MSKTARYQSFRFKSISLLVASLVAIVFTATYFRAPTLLVEPLLRMNRKLSGLEEKTVQILRHEIHYLDSQVIDAASVHAPSQSQIPIVLLHGIFAEKDHWVDFARTLTMNHRVLAPDLPGFGESTRDVKQVYDYAAQVKYLHALLGAWGIERAHVAGNSMGGTIAALFAIQYPERVVSVAFIGAPHGLRSTRPSDMDRQIEDGLSPLIAHDAYAFEVMMGLLFEKRPFIPYPILIAAQRDAIARAVSNVPIWDAQLKDRYLLQDRLPELKAPTFALWGGQDRIFDASGTLALREALPSVQWETLPGTGHLPMMENPSDAAQRYVTFLARLARASPDPQGANRDAKP